MRTPEGHVRDARVDLPPGLAVDPEAVRECPEAQIAALECPESTQVGEDEAQGTAELALGIRKTVTESFPVYNLARRPGEPARFGVEVKSSTLALAESISATKLQSAIYLEGGLSWHHEAETAENSGVPSGDYHEFFEIHNIPTQPELIAVAADLLGRAAGTHAYGRIPPGLHHDAELAERLLQPLDHLPARRLL